MIASGAADVMIGAGVEHMGHVPMTVGTEFPGRGLRESLPAPRD
jgi:acetyl-CoA acetyltransferase